MPKANTDSAIIKIIYIGVILCLGFAGSLVHLASQCMEKTENQRRFHLKQVVQVSKNSIEPILAEYRGKRISVEEALQQVRNRVRTMVYDDHTGKNYIFMSAYDGTMLVQPFEPEKELTDVWNLKDAYGVYIIRELVNVAKSGEGYVSYHYQRPGESGPQKKISYVVGIPELGCYIGTGQYMADINKHQHAYFCKIVGLTFTLLALLFFLIRASTKELSKQNSIIHKAEGELQAIFDNTIQFIGSLSCEGILTKANRSSLALIGKKEADVTGKPFWETPWWTDEVSKQRLKKAFHDSINGRFCRFEATYPSEEIGNVYVDFSLSPIFDDAGEVISLLAEGRDVTQQTKTRDELIKEQIFFNQVVESLPGVFALFKEEGGQFIIQKWNQKQHGKIFGFSYEYMKNAAIDTFIAEYDRPRLKKVVTLIQKQGNISVQFDIKTYDGSLLPVLYQASYFQHSGEKYIVAIGIELTEKIKVEKEKEQLEAMLAQSQRMEAMGTLAGGIAHDFNNILSAILGYAELVKVKLNQPTPIRDTTLILDRQEKLIKATMRAKELVNQILLFSRQSDLEIKPVQPEVIIKEVLALLRSSIPTTIEIRNHVSGNSGVILANPTQIHQILMNLCTNAYHSMKDKGGTLTVSLTKQTFSKNHSIYSEISLRPGGYLRLEVSDTGCGMDRDTLDKIFDPYFTTKEKGEGTGLGLAVVHGIVKKYGGEIKASSELGKGSCFRVYFPEAQEDENKRNADQPDSDLHTGSERILLVDDDRMILDMTDQSLADLGYQVTAFSSAQKALSAFIKNPDIFDLVITDMTMPILTGLDLSREILRINPEVPIILCTGFSELISKEKAQASGIKAFLFKPVLRETLSKTIREVLEMDGGGFFVE